MLDYNQNLEELHSFVKSEERNSENTLTWSSNLDKKQFNNLNDLIAKCNGKIFEMIFNEEIMNHIIQETLNYAHVSHNDSNFTFTESDLKKYIAILLFSGYHSLPQQHLYWERSEDVSTAIILSGNDKK